MILDSQSGLRGVLANAETGQPIRWARWANLETGEYQAFRCDPQIAKERGIPLASLLYRGRCRLKFTPAAPLAAKPPLRIAPSTPLDEIRPEVLRGRKVTPILYVPGLPPPECDEPLCHRAAQYQVADEQLVEPEKGPDGKLYERAVTVGVRKYCSWHFRNPTQLSIRGVQSEVEVSVRPQ